MVFLKLTWPGNLFSWPPPGALVFCRRPSGKYHTRLSCLVCHLIFYKHLSLIAAGYSIIWLSQNLCVHSLIVRHRDWLQFFSIIDNSQMNSGYFVTISNYSLRGRIVRSKYLNICKILETHCPAAFQKGHVHLFSASCWRWGRVSVHLWKLSSLRSSKSLKKAIPFSPTVGTSSN